MKRDKQSRLPWLDGPDLPLYLAPMAGFTDFAFRGICKEFGADVMVSEFVMANKFLDPRGEHAAWELVDFTEAQRPMGVQIFGGEPEKMAEAARRIADRMRPDFIDINYGCPAPKVVNNCAGSSLLRDPCLLQEIAKAVVNAVTDRVPVTAKIRIGWDAQSINAVEVGHRLEEAGIEAIAIHGRTKEQGYRGDADWDVIHAVAESVALPVIGNGNLSDAGTVLAARETGLVKGLMIGRAALGNPWIFREIKTTLATGETLPPPRASERWEVLIRYTTQLLEHRDQSVWDPLNWMRPRLKAFAKNFPGSKKMRRALETVRTVEELKTLQTEFVSADSSLETAE
jgi:tRNA-dihydrouridine synthase B